MILFVFFSALLLWTDKNETFLGLGIEDGFLKLVSNLWNMNDEAINVPTGYLTDGGWHNIKLVIDEKVQILVSIDDKQVYNEVHSSDQIGNLDFVGDSFFMGRFI